MKVLLVLFAFISLAHASVLKAPPSFEVTRGVKAVFVDIKTIDVKLVYDYRNEKVEARSTLVFKQNTIGKPLFDLIPEPSSVLLGEKALKLVSISLPDNASSARALSKSLEPGEYTLKVVNNITKNIRYYTDGLRSAFWMSDLTDRRYLEQYLPVNLEFDQYKINFEVEVINTEKEHQVRTNGEVKTLAKNHFSISYPEYFTASSVFFHMMPKNAFPEENFIFKSIDGREIPVTIYTNNRMSPYVDRTKRVLPELEKDYGPFPHNKIVIYGAGSGGMEYCGATITSLSALGHELIHSYFARGVMPARGNSGWVDEAIASWRDSGYRQSTTRNLSTSRMAGHSVYRRTTDRNAYSKGARFMGFLDKKFQDKGGLKPFLKKFKEERLFKPFLTNEFQNDLQNHFGEDLSPEFSKYIYGNGKSLEGPVEENPFHPKLSEEELLELL